MKRGLIAVFARHRLLANLLMVVFFVLGGVALTRMNIQFFPTFALDVISVRVVWSGASAEDVENGIISPFEERLKTVDGLKKMTSTSTQGIANLSLELIEGTDALLALDQVRQRVDEFRNLPKDAETPQISRVSRYEPVARLLVSGPSLADLRPWVRRFERELLARGVDRVDIAGLPEERIAIEVPGRALETLGLSLDGIGEQVSRLAQDLPSGSQARPTGRASCAAWSSAASRVAFEDLAIVSDDRGLVRLGDVATIVREARPASLDPAAEVADRPRDAPGAPSPWRCCSSAPRPATRCAAARIFDAMAGRHPADAAAVDPAHRLRRAVAAHPRPHRPAGRQRPAGLHPGADPALRLPARAGRALGGDGHPDRLSRGARPAVGLRRHHQHDQPVRRCCSPWA